MADDSVVEVVETGPIAETLREAAVVEDGHVDENEIEEVFVLGDDQITSSGDVLKAALGATMRGFEERTFREARNRIEIGKTVEGTAQTEREIGEPEHAGLGLGKLQVVEPPYPPQLLAAFLEVDETHFRCVRTKTADAVLRGYSLEPVELGDGSPFDPAKQSDEDKKRIGTEVGQIREFIRDCNETIGFEGVLERAWMDYEAIGWAGIEVVRSADMKVRKIAHVPAQRLRVLRGWKGFAEFVGEGKYTYYQPFGQKVVSKLRKTAGTSRPAPYNPREDGDLSLDKLQWNLFDRKTGEPTNKFAESANELLLVPRHHPNTIYYGYTDVVPSLGHLLANVHIRDYLLQFFEHNTVPRYAIIITGAKISDPVKTMLTQYFSTHVKGKPHKTLVVPIPAMKGEVKVEFVKLDADAQEGSFLATRKDNRDGILVAHGMSPAIVGIAEAASLGSGKGLSQAEIYKDRIVTPAQMAAARKINKLFRLGLGTRVVELGFTPLDIRDRKEEMEVHTMYVEKGHWTLNESRQKLGYDPYKKGGDRAFIVTGQGIVFVDELDDAHGAEKQRLEDEVAGLKDEVSRRLAGEGKKPPERKGAGEEEQ